MKRMIALFLSLAIPLVVATSQQAKKSESDIVMPSVLKTVNPKYPENARNAGVEATVYLKVQVTKSGDVGEVTVSKTDDKQFDQAAVDAIRQWKFKPGTKAGKAESVWVTIPVKFKLEKDGKKK